MSQSSEKYQMCTRCVMDTTDKFIRFDDQGVCNHCREYNKLLSKINLSNEEKKNKLDKIITRIKKSGEGKNHDCVLGLSGGVDSSYVAYLAKQYRLRPLIIHLDNGWNSELAVKNIENIVRKLGFDLYTHVIDWEEFKDLQRSFFKASVVDIELLTDHAITAILHKIANKEKIKHIISGGNIATEAVLPKSWNHRKSDFVNIKAIQKVFGSKKIKTFPGAGTLELIFYRLVKNIKTIRLLNYVPYIKEEAIKILEMELDWKQYQVKHGESLFTKFYQNYILPKKFNIDKRKAHYSTLILSSQIKREDALNLLKEELYTDTELEQDKDYVIKKLDFSSDEFENIINSSVKSHYDYPHDILRKLLFTVFKI